MNQIHPTAVVDGSAELGTGNIIGPGVVIYPHVKIGNNNWVGPNTIIGAPPEIKNWEHSPFGKNSGDEQVTVSIGSNNIIRELVVIHSGSQAATIIQDECFIMNSVYIAHDSSLSSKVTLASGVRLAGHVIVEEFANLGMGVLVHQFKRIGAGAIIGMGAVVTKDVLPFTKAFGNPCSQRGVNTIGLSRLNVDETTSSEIVEIYSSGNSEIYLARIAALDVVQDLSFWSL
jgi:UDP-N-acetylglucosamine acyltransferase